MGVVLAVGVMLFRPDAADAAGAPNDNRVRGVSSHVISAGFSHAFALVRGTASGAAGTFAWGTDGNFELGNGSPATGATTPVPSSTYSQIAAGKSFTVAIDWTGSLFGWGLTDKGQTGTSVSATARQTPTKVGTKLWKFIAAGTNHACGITADGNLWCWGDNSLGQLAQNPATTAQTATPTRVGAASDRFISVACGDKFTYAIKADGKLYSWGSNNTAGAITGQLGQGFTEDQSRYAVNQIGSARWVAVAAGGAHGLGIQDDGTLWSWGHNASYQLGDNSTTRRSAPIPLETTSRFLAVSAGTSSSFALRSDGVLLAFGENTAGQLGCCSSPQKVPAAVSGQYQYVSAGSDFTLAVTTTGELRSWGNNASGQLARTGTTTAPAFVPDTSIATFTSIKPALFAKGGGAGSGWTYNGARIKTSGVLETWGGYTDPGSLGEGVLGLASTQSGTSNQLASCDATAKICRGPLPVAYQKSGTGGVFNTSPWVQVSPGSGHMLGIRGDGSLWAWGHNGSGEVGDGTTSTVYLPTKIGSARWLKVVASPASSRSYGIRDDGTLWAWGSSHSSTPTQLCTTGDCAGKRWAFLAAGNEVLAVSTDGMLWGAEAGGAFLKLDGTGTNSPAAWAGLTWLEAHSYAQNTAAIDSSGKLWTWGYDNYGQVGQGVKTFDYLDGVPVRGQFNPLSNVISASECSTSIVAMDAGFKIYGWGQNANNELGIHGFELATPVNLFTGIPVTGSGSYVSRWSNRVPGVQQLVCGSDTSWAIDQTGWGWGTGGNHKGGLGTGSSATADLYPTTQAAIFPETHEVSGGLSASVGNPNCLYSGCVWSTSANQTANTWFQFDTGPKEWRSPLLYSAIYFASSGASNYPRDFKVQVSNDGVAFTTVHAALKGSGQFMTIPLGIQSARYVRITLTANAAVPWDLMMAFVQG